MSTENQQLATTTQALALTTLDDLERVSKSIAASGMFGITKAEQALTLMLICQAEGLNPIAALRRYHLIEGRPSMRADAMQGEFEAKGAKIIWHIRTDEMVAGTAFLDGKAIDDKARERATKRFDMLWELEFEDDANKRAKLITDIAKLSREGEETLIRTFADCQAKGITEGKSGTKANWFSSPRQMLTARFVSEVVRLLNPGLIAGIYSEDETRDIVQQEREFAVKVLTDGPTPTDRTAIEAMIEQHITEATNIVNSAKDKTTQEKQIANNRAKELQGLAAELRCKLADMETTAQPKTAEPAGLTPPEPKEPIKVIDGTTATVEPPKASRKKAEKAQSQVAEPAATETSTPWQEVVCHLGTATGPVLGKKMGDLFAPTSSEKRVTGLKKWFDEHDASTSTLPKDAALYAALKEAMEAWQAAQKPPTPPEKAPAPSKENPPTVEKPTTAASAPEKANTSNWKDYEIASKNPEWHGHKLGEFDATQIKAMQTDYIDKIPDRTKMTLQQKTFAANIAMALAELLPPAANEETPEDAEPEHISRLTAKLIESQIPVETFLAECHNAGWIETSTDLAEITEAEAETLLSDWASVQAQVDVIE